MAAAVVLAALVEILAAAVARAVQGVIVLAAAVLAVRLLHPLLQDKVVLAGLQQIYFQIHCLLIV